MNQITVSNEKKLTTPDRKALMPYEVTADGEVIGVMREPGVVKIKTQCPNCKFVHDYTEPDNKPPYFTMKHPIEVKV